MNNLFVSYEFAVKLKGEGFLTEHPFGYYSSTGLLITNNVQYYYSEDYFNEKEKYYISPLFQQVVDWFKDKHNIEIIVFPKLYGGGISYCFDCVKMNQRSTAENLENLTKGIYVLYNSSKECFEGAFNEALEMINE